MGFGFGRAFDVCCSCGLLSLWYDRADVAADVAAVVAADPLGRFTAAVVADPLGASCFSGAAFMI